MKEETDGRITFLNIIITKPEKKENYIHKLR